MKLRAWSPAVGKSWCELSCEAVRFATLKSDQVRAKKFSSAEEETSVWAELNRDLKKMWHGEYLEEEGQKEYDPEHLNKNAWKIL